MKLGCVIMAAGESRRFGGNKLAAVIEGKPLYQRALEAVPSGVFERVVVVTGQTVIAEAAERMGFCPVENREPGLGVSRTIRLGLEALGDVDGALFMTADQPFLTSDTLCALASAFGGEEIVAAAHKGERGNPCLFPRKIFPALLSLSGDTGGGRVIKTHPECLKLVEIPAAELMDVDTKEMLCILERTS